MFFVYDSKIGIKRAAQKVLVNKVQFETSWYNERVEKLFRVKNEVTK